MNLSDFNDVLTPDDLIKILPLGRSKIYQLLRDEDIKSKKCGTQYLINKLHLMEFLGLTPEEILAHLGVSFKYAMSLLNDSSKNDLA